MTELSRNMPRSAPFLVALAILVSSPVFCSEVTDPCTTNSLPPSEVTGNLRDDAHAAIRSDITTTPKHYRRLLTEMSAALLFGTACYYAEDQGQDYDYEDSPDTIQEKLTGTDTWKLDDNSMELNSPGHPAAGALYYIIARSCGFNEYQAAICTLGGSLMWENFVEYREITSINDLVMTEAGGLAFGETLYQLGPFLRRLMPGGRLIERTEPWHSFRACALAGVTENRDGTLTDSAVHLGLHTRVVNEEGYGAPGSVERSWSGATSTELTVEGLYGGDRMSDFTVLAKTVWIGYFGQRLRRRTGGGLGGYSVFIGPATAYEHSERLIHDRHDQLAVADVLGPSFHADIYGDEWSLTASLEAFLDFAAVTAHALPSYDRNHRLDGAKSPLQNQGYYYAWGFTVWPRATLVIGSLELTGEARLRQYDSIEGWDRFQDRLTDDFNIVDRFLSYRACVAHPLPWENFKAQLSVENLYRHGRIRETVQRDSETTYLGGIAVAF